MLNANHHRLRHDGLLLLFCLLMAVSFQCIRSIYQIGFCWKLWISQNEQSVIKWTKTIFFIQEMRKYVTYFPVPIFLALSPFHKSILDSCCCNFNRIEHISASCSAEIFMNGLYLIGTVFDVRNQVTTSRYTNRNQQRLKNMRRNDWMKYENTKMSNDFSENRNHFQSWPVLNRRRKTNRKQNMMESNFCDFHEWWIIFVEWQICKSRLILFHENEFVRKWLSNVGWPFNGIYWMLTKRFSHFPTIQRQMLSLFNVQNGW